MLRSKLTADPTHDEVACSYYCYTLEQAINALKQAFELILLEEARAIIRKEIAVLEKLLAAA